MKKLVMTALVSLCSMSVYCQKNKITDRDNGKTLILKKNKVFSITLDDPGDAGYKFLPCTYDSSILKLMSTTHLDPVDGAVGDFGKGRWSFMVVKANEITQVVIRDEQPWIHNNESPEVKFSLNVKTTLE